MLYHIHNHAQSHTTSQSQSQSHHQPQSQYTYKNNYYHQPQSHTKKLLSSSTITYATTITIGWYKSRSVNITNSIFMTTKPTMFVIFIFFPYNIIIISMIIFIMWCNCTICIDDEEDVVVLQLGDINNKERNNSNPFSHDRVTDHLWFYIFITTLIPNNDND
eukprot:476084_1